MTTATGWGVIWVVVVLLACATAVRADELQLITDALFGQLNRTATFDANGDGAVTVADLSAQAGTGEPGTAGCGVAPAPAGRQMIEVDSTTRQYVVRLPAGFDNRRPHPLVFAFHGFTDSAAGEERVAQLAAHWPDAIGVYGEGLRRTFPAFPGIVGQGWQLAPGESDDRDVHFFDALLARLRTQYCVNPRRVYVTGHSNGAYLSHILACLRGTTVAAIGPMAGSLLACPRTDRVAVIINHGTVDNIVPFILGVAAHDFWVARNGCTAQIESYAMDCAIRPNCAGDHHVAFCGFVGTHTPDPMFPAKMYRFFREHAL